MAHSLEIPHTRTNSSLGVTCFTVAIGSIFLALMSQISVPIPFSPIPITMQTWAVFILGGILGSRKAAYSVMAYLAQGTTGLPVFAGGVSNPLWFMDIRVGYLCAFVIAAYLVGRCVEKSTNPSLFSIFWHIALAQCVIYCLGWICLSFFIGMKAAFIVGVVPFWSGALIKTCAAGLFIRGYSLLKAQRAVN